MLPRCGLIQLVNKFLIENWYPPTILVISKEMRAQTQSRKRNNARRDTTSTRSD